MHGSSEIHVVSINLLHTFGTYSGYVIVEGEKFEIEVVVVIIFIIFIIIIIIIIIIITILSN